jgi:hypothetical protein
VSITSPVEFEVIVHPVSVGKNPVPVTVTTVAGVLPAGGEPEVGLRVTAACTPVKVADAESPVAPVAVTVYDCLAAVFETMKLVPVVLSKPVESIAQVYEVNNPVGVAKNDLHVPLSRVENGFGVVATSIVVPATP